MALVRGTGNANYRRFNWMGSDKSESSFENTILLRDGGDTNPGTGAGKKRTREQRTRVVREVRCYLDHLRKEILQNDIDAELTGMPKSGYKREESDVLESEKASMNLSCLVRGARYRSGEGFASPYDGTSHGSADTLTKYNAHCRQILTDIIEDKKKRLGEKQQQGATLSQREMAALEEAETIELPKDEDAQLTAEEQEVLHKPEGEAVEEKKAICEQYTEKALASAKELLRFNIVRNANLYASFRELSLSCETSMREDNRGQQQQLATPPPEENGDGNGHAEAPEENGHEETNAAAENQGAGSDEKAE